MNTLRPTETEIVSVDDCMTAVLCNRYCLDAQGYDTFENIAFQYNKSAIIFENNGKASISKRTNHINISYYFVKNSIEK